MDPLETFPLLSGPVVGGERLSPKCALDEILVGEMVRRKIPVGDWIFDGIGEGAVPGWILEKVGGEVMRRKREREEREEWEGR
jgi:hypothetical protein